MYPLSFFKQQVANCCPPFGEQVDLTVPAEKVTENFTGKEKDDETELNYFGARYLDPMLGMWISVDAARQYQNPYLYAGNNPIMRVDPDGNQDANAIMNGVKNQILGSFVNQTVKPQLETAGQMLWNGTMTTLAYERKIMANLTGTFVPGGAAVSLLNDAVDGYMEHGADGAATNVLVDVAFMRLSKYLPDNPISNTLQSAANEATSNMVNKILFEGQPSSLLPTDGPAPADATNIRDPRCENELDFWGK